MNDLRQAAQQALETLEILDKVMQRSPRTESAITALRAALAEPDSDYERGFVDGMNLQTKGSVDKVVNRMAEPEQEPVAWMDIDDNGQRLTVRQWSDGNKDEVPLYTAPTPRKPLTDEEIEALWQNTSPYYDHQDFARAIERAHGIGEQDGS